MCNIVFGKAVENVSNHRDIKSTTTEKRRSYLVLASNYHTIKWLLENLAIEINKTERSISFWTLAR